ncbi:hypothetical protein AVEN_102286-1 [Araneus ventricosus]|uniref:Uncharacterized protein n=1 Tax=Araneus ventricosus TaxID=182803 RepID=A0A4Y2SVP8_ARAVE|nr:hypothetical protein AVEN_102286-1 [Araneus ventricosus]
MTMDIDGSFLAKRRKSNVASRGNKTGSKVREACLLSNTGEISASEITAFTFIDVVNIFYCINGIIPVVLITLQVWITIEEECPADYWTLRSKQEDYPDVFENPADLSEEDYEVWVNVDSNFKTDEKLQK